MRTLRKPSMYRWQGQWERRCVDCAEWYPVVSYYTDGRKVRSRCRECFIADIVRRKRAKRDPSLLLAQLWRAA